MQQEIEYKDKITPMELLKYLRHLQSLDRRITAVIPVGELDRIAKQYIIIHEDKPTNENLF